MRTPFDHLWNFSDPAQTEAAFEAFKPQVASDLNLSLQLLTQIARTYGLRRNFDDAHKLLDHVEKNTPADPDFDVVRVRLWLERGRTYNSAGDKAAARPLFLKALETAGAIKSDFYAVDAAHMLGIVDPPKKQIGWTEKALAMAEASNDAEARGWLGSLYNNLGWSYHDIGAFEKALVTFQKGADWQAAHKNGQVTERIARWTVGRSLRSLQRFTEALSVQHAVEQAWAAAGVEDGYVFEELGELYLATGRPEHAAPYFARAYMLLSGDYWLKNHEADRLARLKRLGQPDSHPSE